MQTRTKRAQLLEDGYCVVERVLSREMLERLRAATDDLLEKQDPERLRRARATGSMIPVVSDPFMAELVAWPPALAALADLGFPHPTFSDGWIISKPPHSPRLFWHYDWFTWEDARSYEPEPPQVFLMYYLVDTAVENGCLRVIPGSHVRHNPIHDLLAAPHSEELTEARNVDAVEFSSRPDEVSLPVRAGDLVVGDARLLHAAHANETDERRTLITLWYQPDLASLPERMRAQLAAKRQDPPPSWPRHATDLVAPLLVRYEGAAEPYGRSLYRPREPADGRRS
jgi:ectoine hydroxylase-related dioxygenase (phytanoyl-CoA dioxygenase family)